MNWETICSFYILLKLISHPDRSNLLLTECHETQVSPHSPCKMLLLSSSPFSAVLTPSLNPSSPNCIKICHSQLIHHFLLVYHPISLPMEPANVSPLLPQLLCAFFHTAPYGWNDPS